MVSYSDIVAARENIGKYIYRTPLEPSIHLSGKGSNVFLKLECQQRLKSFKVRGALNKLMSLSEEEKRKGVIAVSSGNHGAGVSYSARVLGGIDAKIFVPETTPKAKVEKIEYYGATIVKTGVNYDEAHMAALEIQKKEQRTFVDPCSDPVVIAGAGTIALEIIEQCPDTDIILVPIGGGGLITGIGVAAKQLKPSVKIIGVQTGACPAMIRSLQDNICYTEYPTEPSICDALVGGVGEIPFQMAKYCIDDILEVGEALIRKAVRHLLTTEKAVAEPASAVGIAAVLDRPSIFEGRNTAVVITGGNLDDKLMRDILNG